MNNTVWRAGNADGYFKPQQMSAKGDMLNFDVSPLQNLRNKLRPEDKPSTLHEPFILLGRDVLNIYRIMLDGPLQVLEVHGP